MSMAPDAVMEDLVTANRILAHKQIVDAFGHVSVRHPTLEQRFLISCSMAPGLVTKDDIMVLDLAGEPTDDKRPAFLERYIHAAIYAARPDVGAVVHSHSAAVVPFGIVASASLKPVFHMCGFLGHGAPVFEIRDCGGPASDMLVRTPTLGRALSETLGAASVVLMRGHGSTVVGSTLPVAVYRSIYLEVNARVQLLAQQLGDVTFLNTEESANAELTNRSQVNRAWQLWQREVGR